MRGIALVVGEISVPDVSVGTWAGHVSRGEREAPFGTDDVFDNRCKARIFEVRK